MSEGIPILFLLIPVVFLIVTLGLFAFVARQAGGRLVEVVYPEDEEQAGRPVAEPERPWWGNPLLWLGVAAGFILLGLFVAPAYLGGAFVFVPFFWVWRPRRRR